MQILLRSIKIIDPNSKFNGKIKDVLIVDGVIEQIGDNIDATEVNEVIEGDDLHVSTGWVDLYAKFGDPGEEHKEDLETGLNAAAQGGFTKVLLSPEASPCVDSKSGVDYILKKSSNHIVDALPMAGMTKGLEGSQLAEIYDMVQTGAVAISNGKHPISNSKVQNLGLLYSKNLNVPLFSFCDDKNLSHGGQMHEGEVNTSIGLKGIPTIAEEIMVARDIFLSEYAGVPIHFSHISTKGSVELIREAKGKGLKVTASTPVHHLLLSDKTTTDFDSNFKVNPPFRDESHIEALKAGLEDGTIDAVISDHEPQEIEAKFSEFGIAEFGIIALETAFSALLMSVSNSLKLEEIIEKLTAKPRAILGLELPKIEEGETAELTVFSPTISWVYEKKDVKSKSHNSPLLGQELTGLPIAVINNNQFYLNS
jgi:dihydroorotase